MLDKLKNLPYITITICSILILLFILNALNPALFESLSGSTSKWRSGDLSTAFTYSLCHLNVWHLLLNVSMILYVGSKIEIRINRLTYIFLYLASAIVAGIFFLHLYASNGYTSSVLGASGVKCGLIGFYISMVVYTILKTEDNQVIQDELNGSKIVFALAVFEIFLSFLPNIAWQAHIGGALAGVVFAIMIMLYKELLNKKQIEK